MLHFRASCGLQAAVWLPLIYNSVSLSVLGAVCVLWMYVLVYIWKCSCILNLGCFFHMIHFLNVHFSMSFHQNHLHNIPYVCTLERRDILKSSSLNGKCQGFSVQRLTVNTAGPVVQNVSREIHCKQKNYVWILSVFLPSMCHHAWPGDSHFIVNTNLENIAFYAQQEYEYVFF